MAKATHTFHWADYTTFGLSLAVSLAIGLYLMWAHRKEKNTKQYIQGGGNLNPFAVACSAIASTLNAVFIIGAPAETYYYGTIYSLVFCPYVLIVVSILVVFIPIYRNVKVVSAYEYLELRFQSKVPRIAGALSFTISMLFLLSIVLYAPALAFNQVTGINLDMVLIICGLVCTLYVVVGGMKAVVWTDTLQIVIVILGMIVLVSMGTNAIPGGASAVWRIAKENNRVNFDIFDTDLRIRHTFWTQMIAGFFVWIPPSGSNQMIIQRYYAVRSTNQARLAIVISAVVYLVLLMLVVYLGLLTFAYYTVEVGCDPMLGGMVTRGDQIVPLFLMEILGKYHGLPGLLCAAVFAAALSTVSSIVNSLAAVFLQDLIKPLYALHRKGQTLSGKTCTYISQGLSLGFGLMSIGLSYMATYLGPLIIQVTSSIWAVLGTPLFGMFALAYFVPSANGYGAVLGMVVSTAVCLWFCVGALMYTGMPPPLMPLGQNCSNLQQSIDNLTSDIYSYSNVSDTPSPPVATGLEMYKISYMWYGIIGIGLTMSIGIVSSWIINHFTDDVKIPIEDIDPKSMYTLGNGCFSCFPVSARKIFNCGVRLDDDYTDADYTKRDSGVVYKLAQKPQGEYPDISQL